MVLWQHLSDDHKIEVENLLLGFEHIDPEPDDEHEESTELDDETGELILPLKGKLENNEEDDFKIELPENEYVTIEEPIVIQLKSHEEKKEKKVRKRVYKSKAAVAPKGKNGTKKLAETDARFNYTIHKWNPWDHFMKLSDEERKCMHCHFISRASGDTRRIMKDHIISKHRDQLEDEDRVVAEECYLRRWQYNIQNRYKKTEVINAVCPTCGKVCRHKYALENHLKTHKEIIFKASCPECGKGFREDNEEYQNHLAYHRGEEPYKCQECGKSFTTKKILRTHHKTKHGPQRASKHICQECGRDCETRMRLFNHTLSHTGEKPYKCTACDAAYASASALTYHIRKHPELQGKIKYPSIKDFLP